MIRKPLSIASGLGIVMLSMVAAAESPVAVSPGELDRLSPIQSSCPSFSWSYLEGVLGYELVVYLLPKGSAAEIVDAEPVLLQTFSKGVSSWTPPSDRCLQAGSSYAWSIRTSAGDESGEWSEPRLFTIRALPSATEVRDALELLKEYVAGGGQLEGPDFESDGDQPPRRETAVEAKGNPAAARGPGKSVVPGTAAIRGDQTDASGVTYGVHGSTASSESFSSGVVGDSTAASGLTFGVSGWAESPGGAGVAAINTSTAGDGTGLLARSQASDGTAVNAEAEATSGSAIGVLGQTNASGGSGVRASHRNPSGGADLTLDGSEQGLTDTVLTESGLDRSSASLEIFDFQNSGGGSLTLQADGIDLVTTATDQDTLGTLQCVAGEVAKVNAGVWTCSSDLDTAYSPGFGLELAGTTFGVKPAVIQRRVTDSCVVGQSVRAVNEDGTVVCETPPDEDTLAGLSCSDGWVAKRNSGVWVCATDLDTDTNTVYSPGFGLDLAGTTFSVKPAVIQQRVAGSCVVGQSVRAVNEDGTVLCEALPSAPPTSLFGVFGGSGGPNRSVIGVEDLGTAPVVTYHDLTVPAGATLVVNKGFAYIAASGTCDIAGTIDANGRGQAGAAAIFSANSAPGRPGSRAAPIEVGHGMSGTLNAAAVSFAVSGGGGGGGGANGGGGSATRILARGGDGGGALTRGGAGGCMGCSSIDGGAPLVNIDSYYRATFGLGSGSQGTDAFHSFLFHPGAGGGSGAVGSSGGTPGSGGDGGGVVYLECNTLSFTGTITALGTTGGGASGDAGGGGGGGAGVILIRARNISSSSGLLQVAASGGGTGSGTGGSGGWGLAGFWDLVDLP